MKRYEKNILYIVSIIIIISFFSIIFSRETFSENENRFLKKFPKFSLDTFKTTEYMQDIEKYTSDHFPFRDKFTNIETKIKKVLGIKENNSIFFAKDEFLVENYKENKEEIDRRIDIINKFINNLESNDTKLKNISIMISPTSLYAYGNKLDEYQRSYAGDEKSSIDYIYKKLNDGINEDKKEMVKLIDVFEDIKASVLYNEKNNIDELLYFRLDHHWTVNGAFVAYNKFARDNNMKAFSKDMFNKILLSDDFKGTNYSRSFEYSYTPDIMEKYELKDKVLKEKFENIKVTYFDSETNTEKVTNSIYFDKYLETKDKYSYFLENNPPYMIVSHKNKDILNSDDMKESILVLKDSYANVLVPFLINHYKKIYVVDLRYFGYSISDYIKNNEIEDVLLIYNILTFQDDLGIVKLR